MCPKVEINSVAWGVFYNCHRRTKVALSAKMSTLVLNKLLWPMIVREIYERSTDRSCNDTLVLHLDRSPRVHYIAQVIQQRQTSWRRKNVDKLESLNREESKAFCATTAGGLPSPPVESPECTSEILSTSETKSAPAPRSTITAEELTKVEICRRLEELKEEKHQLFQLIKRLMFEEAQEERRRRRHSTMEWQHFTKTAVHIFSWASILRPSSTSSRKWICLKRQTSLPMSLFFFSPFFSTRPCIARYVYCTYALSLTRTPFFSHELCILPLSGKMKHPFLSHLPLVKTLCAFWQIIRRCHSRATTFHQHANAIWSNCLPHEWVFLDVFGSFLPIQRFSFLDYCNDVKNKLVGIFFI